MMARPGSDPALSPMSAPPASPLVEIRNLNFGYADALTLEDLSLTVPRGKVTALIGPMGAVARPPRCA